MIRTNVVTLSVIKAIAYRRKLPSGGSGIVILREDVSQPGIAAISKTSGEAIISDNTPGRKYPKKAFQEAMELTYGLPYKKQGPVQLKGEIRTEEETTEEVIAEEVIVDGAEYQKIVEKYTDKSGKLSYALLNKDMIRFARASSVARKMIADGAEEDRIRLYVTGTKFRNISGNSKLTDAQILAITELLDEVSPVGVFKEFNDEIRKALSKR